MAKVILHSATIDDSSKQQLIKHFHAGIDKKEGYSIINADIPVTPEDIHRFRLQLPFDINMLPDSFDQGDIGLLITDMDSTLISIECVDEIADFLGIKKQVATITESAMRGEIDFPTSLQQRVSLLKGLDESVLQKVYDERLTLNPGAETLIKGLKKLNIKTALVSGGFTFFTKRLQQRLKLDFTLANMLAIENGKLTGEVLGDIVDGTAKANFLDTIANQCGIQTTQSIAMGDGANDLLMMNISGLGVAYHAKPAVQTKADIVLNYSGLDAVLHLLEP